MMISQAGKWNKRAEIMSSAPDSSSFTAHTRGRVLLGYEVPPDDVKLETVNLTAEEMSEIMNLATKHSGEQYTMC